ncbi:MAG TPA: putative quinol monooxygenase [Geminicoccus sp.]|uniref:putative quinol monooxygenase n=1 Tax=Geminicoccus sp. TaxID=2024832 RepID=UPI002C8FDC1B|nr:putative quinol monooxygenase [Geminicoccus sp.]HWL71587.1 putative quinol monooxygenase [Geminicoccus sp.]
MITITAIIKAKPGHEEEVHQALLQCGSEGSAHEPGTLGYHVGRAVEDPAVFTTYERFADREAMDQHNATTGKRFFDAVGHLLDGAPTFAVCEEIWVK